LLCDDHELVRRGLHALLDADLTLEVVGEASSADEAVEKAAPQVPAARNRWLLSLMCTVR
jgi:DNA-binding NarL/FixJ family response regulator